MENKIVKISTEDVVKFRKEMGRIIRKDFTPEELELRKVRLARMRKVTERIDRNSGCNVILNTNGDG